MILDNIKLKNFRNYDDLFLTFNSKINIFIGDNAQGKTNILESIYMLAITKSHRTFIDSNLIKFGTKFAKIKGNIRFDEKASLDEMTITISNKGKKVSFNNNVIKKISEYISKLNVIIFCPDDLEIIKGSPSIRRKFLNVELSQLFNKYIIYLNNYNNVLKNRNEYLKKITIDNVDQYYLEIITNQLIDNAIELIKFRKIFVDDLNKEILKIYKKIVDEKEMKIKYDTVIDLEDMNDDILRKKLKEKYAKYLYKDILLSQTMAGPHRDDFKIYISNKELKDYGSQGQQRIAVLCLKLAEINIFKTEKKEYPILLLDDIFSELDISKRNKIIKYINKKMQIFITTTDINSVESKIIKRASIFYVKNANIIIKEEVI